MKLKNAICILCNNLEYLRTILDNLIYKNNDNIDIILINEIRYNNIYNEIKKNCKDITNIIVINGNDILDKLKKEIVDTPFVDEYIMGINILMQRYIYKFFSYNKVIFLDDDVIINNVDELFDYDKCLFYKFRLSAGAKTLKENSLQYKNLIKCIENIFEVEITENNYAEMWINNHLSSGNRMYIRKDFNIKEYEKYLKRFFENSYIRYLWSKRKTHGSYYLDEWFESFFAYKTNIINDLLREKKYVYVEISNDNKVNFEKYTKVKEYLIWHNATCKHKLDWLKKLKFYNIIK